MSRRPTPNQAAQNQQVIKSLLKLDPNKTCADCKRNKHPRWASWNLGIFICIRCSGIHRGMGTHISRVKSVDLDAWTDEQLQSVVKWGNARANKYWEAKLAPGHVPSEAKIENFIRTKYDSKRWVMDGGMPDPSTLEAGDDDVPLAVVQEKAKLERSASQRPPVSRDPPPPAQHKQTASVSLFDDDEIVSPPARPSTTDPTPRVQPPQQPQSAPKQHRANDSLLGLDFFGSPQPAPSSRPASISSTPTGSSGMSRPDLKQSILSLYAKPQPAPAQHQRQPSFGDMASPPPPSASSSNMGGLTDAFSGLSFPSTTSPPPKPAEKPSPFANLASYASAKSSPAAPKLSSPTASASGGAGVSLFDSLTSPTAPPQSKPQSHTTSISSGQDFFGGFASPSLQPQQSKPQPPPAPSASDDLFGLASPPLATTAPPPPKPKVSSPQEEMKSAFNLNPSPAPAPKPVTSPSVSTPAVTANIPPSSIDPWGGGNAWSNPDPETAAPAAPSTADMMKVPETITANDISPGGWGASSPKPAPTVAADEDFGGWESAAPVSSTTASTKPAGGFGGADDLFSNVWE
ncbi:hypothetical protein SI65_07157 [Aspergillus cristatus]|uniref:Arf-GAP domain-containing protein n=1 Tax=Aspergillus cristatus TaxID=573508 RepID=A0A1E3B944_ASPCR|nr:hypothetical protein SI65_07157 [Aspergillus cristatus]